MMKLLAMGIMLISIASCVSSEGYSTKIKLEGGEMPTFVLSGNGILGNFIVYGPRQRSGSDGRAFTVWEIQPVKKGSQAKSLKEIGLIKYGVVPTGYKQIYPANGSIPPPVVSGVRYAYWAQTINAPHAREEFELINGKATEIPGNGVKKE